MRGRHKGKAPFKFENSRLLTPNFGTKVKEWWDSFVVVGSTSYVFCKKLRLLKRKLIEWNRDVMGNIKVLMDQWMTKCYDIDLKEEFGSLEDSEEKRKQ